MLTSVVVEAVFGPVFEGAVLFSSSLLSSLEQVEEYFLLLAWVRCSNSKAVYCVSSSLMLVAELLRLLLLLLLLVLLVLLVLSNEGENVKEVVVSVAFVAWRLWRGVCACCSLWRALRRIERSNVASSAEVLLLLLSCSQLKISMSSSELNEVSTSAMMSCRTWLRSSLMDCVPLVLLSLSSRASQSSSSLENAEEVGGSPAVAVIAKDVKSKSSFQSTDDSSSSSCCNSINLWTRVESSKSIEM